MPDRSASAQETARGPLGVRPEASLTSRQLRALAELEAYDLTPVRERVLREGSMPSRLVDEAVLEFRRYLALKALLTEDVPGMLSPQVDEVWHTCLLFTRLYADLCRQCFGTFVHHEPDTEEHRDPLGRWEAFEVLYSNWFGQLSRVWTIHRPIL